MTSLRRGSCVLAVLLASAWARPAAPQQPVYSDSLLDRMAGRWVLQGTIDGRPTTHDVGAEWVLAHGYMRLTEVSRESGPDGRAAYQAIVFIGADPARKGYACLWLDSTGGTGLDGRAIGHADPARGDSLAFLFDLPGMRFHTTFLYERSTDSWRWLMDGEGEAGRREPFARVRLTRASHGAPRSSPPGP